MRADMANHPFKDTCKSTKSENVWYRLHHWQLRQMTGNVNEKRDRPAHIRSRIVLYARKAGFEISDRASKKKVVSAHGLIPQILQPMKSTAWTPKPSIFINKPDAELTVLHWPYAQTDAPCQNRSPGSSQRMEIARPDMGIGRQQSLTDSIGQRSIELLDLIHESVKAQQ
jgi:hypothetical protein